METYKEGQIKEGDIIRQGDVTLVRVGKIPSGGSKIAAEDGKTILAHGEVTGHHHALPAETSTLYDLGMGEEKRFLELVEDGQLTHQEHDPLHVPAGYYEVRRQLQYRRGAIERVAD